MIDTFLQTSWKYDKYNSDPAVVQLQWRAYQREGSTYSPHLPEHSQWARFNGWLKEMDQLQVRLPTWRIAKGQEIGNGRYTLFASSPNQSPAQVTLRHPH